MSRNSSPLNENEVHFAITDNTLITNDTMKVTAVVAMILSEHATPDDVARDILNKFIDAEWVFNTPTRWVDTGVERAQFVAYARVPLSENYQLEERRKAVSQPGCEITSYGIDQSITEKSKAEAAIELRLKLMKQALKQAEVFSELCHQHYRVANISFGNLSNHDTSLYGNSATAAATYATNASTSATNAAMSASNAASIAAHSAARAVTSANLVANAVDTHKFYMTASIVLATSDVPQK